MNEERNTNEIPENENISEETSNFSPVFPVDSDGKISVSEDTDYKSNKRAKIQISKNIIVIILVAIFILIAGVFIAHNIEKNKAETINIDSSESTIEATKNNITPVLSILGTESSDYSITLSYDEYQNLDDIKLFNLSGAVSFIASESSPKIQMVEWHSNEPVSHEEFDEFINAMNILEESKYTLQSYDAISSETYLWLEYGNSRFVCCWYQEDKIYVRWYYEEAYASTPTPKPTVSPTKATVSKSTPKPEPTYIPTQEPTQKPIDNQTSSEPSTMIITKDYKPNGNEPDWIALVSYCEVQMPKVIGYDASISLSDDDTRIVKTGLRYKIETDLLKLKADKSYHKAIFILEFDEKYETYRVTTAEVDGIKFR